MNAESSDLFSTFPSTSLFFTVSAPPLGASNFRFEIVDLRLPNPVLPKTGERWKGNLKFEIKNHLKRFEGNFSGRYLPAQV